MISDALKLVDAYEIIKSVGIIPWHSIAPLLKCYASEVTIKKLYDLDIEVWDNWLKVF